MSIRIPLYNERQILIYRAVDNRMIGLDLRKKSKAKFIFPEDAKVGDIKRHILNMRNPYSKRNVKDRNALNQIRKEQRQDYMYEKHALRTIRPAQNPQPLKLKKEGEHDEIVN